MPVELARVKQVFLAAVEKSDRTARDVYLNEACAGDDELRRQVEALLAQHEQASGHLEAPPANVFENTGPYAVTASEVAPQEACVRRIGPYNLLQQLGEGGMGTVYLAEQEEPVKRRVALKIIKAGMDSSHIIARFEAERQALAMMDHAHIARIFDAGTTENGRPYFVMELVKGIPITRYCDQEHLTLRERLELFLPVCQAVQHAHQKGIIHRDLKPSNVLVALYDGKPVPKVIDFGLAKATEQKLTGRTMFTEVGQMVGTLEYMAPEQAELNNLDIDTRADIYSLGVILYELLTGSPPFTAKQLRSAAFTEMLRMIREVEPRKPSTKLSSSDELPSIAANRKLQPARLTRLVLGDLDWIAMKCLAKERSRRYETANGLAMDIQRYLTDEPVLAGPPSVAYRLRKFGRRNRRELATGAAVVVAFFCAAGALGWAVRDREARQAEAVRREATRVSNLEEEIRRALTLVELAVKGDRLPAALTAIQRAEWLLASGGTAEQLRSRVHRWLAELKLARGLAECRLLQVASEATDPGFAEVFGHYGLRPDEQEVEKPAECIRASPIKDLLIAGLHDWARWDKTVRGSGRHHWKVLLEIAAKADPDPWRDQMREAVRVKDARTLQRMANDGEVRDQHPNTSLLLIYGLYWTGQDPLAIEVLRKVRRQHPDDVFVNTELGH